MRYALVVALMWLCACNPKSWKFGLEGSGTVASEERVIAAFHAIHAKGDLTIQVRAGEPETSCALRADDNLLGHIQTQVVDGVLTLNTDQALAPSETPTVVLRTAALDSVHVSGAGKLTVTGVHGESFDLDLSGAASVDLAGEVTRASLEVSGAGLLRAAGLKAQETQITLSGAGRAEVYAARVLMADISGAGSVAYAGNPNHVQKKISGVGAVTRLEP